MANDAALYVYGIVAASDQAAISASGVKEAAVRTVEHGPVAALVSDIDAGVRAAAREVRAHWRVIEEASGLATVVPVRFGTVMEDERDVRERVLEPNADRLAELLGALAGRVQLNVKGAYDEQQLLREVVAGSPAVATLRERLRGVPEQAGYYEQIQLGELVAGEVQRRRERDGAIAMDRLAPLAVDVIAGQPVSDESAFDLAFLVERGEIDAFSKAVAALGEELGERVAIRYVGPLPPYSFADVDLTAGSGAWA